MGKTLPLRHPAPSKPVETIIARQDRRIANLESLILSLVDKIDRLEQLVIDEG